MRRKDLCSKDNRFTQTFLFVWCHKSGRQAALHRQYERFNGDTFLDFLKIIHSKFPKCYLFMDKASHHITGQER